MKNCSICLSCYRCVRHPVTREARAQGYGHLYSCRAGKWELVERRSIPRIAHCDMHDGDGEIDQVQADRQADRAGLKFVADKKPTGEPKSQHINLAIVLPASILDSLRRYIRGPAKVYIPILPSRSPVRRGLKHNQDGNQANTETPAHGNSADYFFVNLRRHIPKAILAAIIRHIRRKSIKLPTMAYLPASKSNETRADIRSRIVAMYIDSRSIRHVAKATGYCRFTVRQVLREEGAYQPPTTGIKKARPETESNGYAEIYGDGGGIV